MPDITDCDGLSIEGIPFFKGDFCDYYLNYHINLFEYKVKSDQIEIKCVIL